VATALPCGNSGLRSAAGKLWKPATNLDPRRECDRRSSGLFAMKGPEALGPPLSEPKSLTFLLRDDSQIVLRCENARKQAPATVWPLVTTWSHGAGQVLSARARHAPSQWTSDAGQTGTRAPFVGRRTRAQRPRAPRVVLVMLPCLKPAAAKEQLQRAWPNSGPRLAPSRLWRRHDAFRGKPTNRRTPVCHPQPREQGARGSRHFP
jgi:hypothetical protein